MEEDGGAWHKEDVKSTAREYEVEDKLYYSTYVHSFNSLYTYENDYYKSGGSDGSEVIDIKEEREDEEKNLLVEWTRRSKPHRPKRGDEKEK